MMPYPVFTAPTKKPLKRQLVTTVMVISVIGTALAPSQGRRSVLGDERAYTASDDMGDIEERSKWVVVACLRWR